MIVWLAYSGVSSGGPSAGKTRITVLAVGARMEPGSRSYTIGGDPKSDAIVQAGLPAGLVRLWRERRTANGAPSVDCSLPVPAASPVPGRGALATPGTATRLCLAVGQNILPAAAVVEVDGTPLGLVPIAAFQVCRDGCDSGARASDVNASDRNSLYLPSAVSSPNPRFLYYWIDGSGRAYAGPADRQPPRIRLSDGTRIVVRSAAPLRPGELYASLDDLQAWTVSDGPTMVYLAPDPPELVPSEPGAVALVTAAEADTPRSAANILPIRSLGADYSTLLAAHQLILPGAAVGRTYVRADRAGFQRNEAVTLSSEDRALRLRVEPLTVGEGLPQAAKWASILILIAGAALTWRIRLNAPVAALILGIVESFLSLRLLIAIEGWIVDGTNRTVAAVPQAMVALPLGIFVVAMALAGPGQRLRPALGFTVLAGAALVLVARVQGSVSAQVLVETAVLLVLATAVILCAVFLPRAASPRYRRFVVRAMRLRVWRWRVGPVGVAAPAVVVAAGLILALRWGFKMGNAREEVMLWGYRLALSIVFVPLTLFAAAPLLTAMARARRPVQLGIGLLAFAVFIGVGVALPNWKVAGDGGAALVLAIALIVAATAALLARRAPLAGSAFLVAGAGAGASVYALAGWYGGWSLWWAPLIPMGALSLALFALSLSRWPQAAAVLANGLWLAPILSLAGVLLWIAYASGSPAASPAVAAEPPPAIGRTEARLMAVLAPARFATMMSRESVRIRSAEVQLRDYGAASAGRGYLNLIPPTELRRQQFTDYGAAIHLISPFGRLAAAGLLLMLGAASVAAFAAAAALRSIRGWAGGLAWTAFATTSTYIILANIMAAPFTGRNVYLLAPTSLADLFEGLLLLALAAGLLRSETSH
jgi:hypothetical protein